MGTVRFSLMENADELQPVFKCMKCFWNQAFGFSYLLAV